MESDVLSSIKSWIKSKFCQSAIPTPQEIEAKDLDYPHALFYLKDGTVYIRVKWSKADSSKTSFLKEFNVFLYAIQSGGLTKPMYNAINFWADCIGDKQVGDTLIKTLHENLVNQAVEIASNVIDAHEEEKQRIVMLPSEVFSSYVRNKKRKGR